MKKLLNGFVVLCALVAVTVLYAPASQAVDSKSHCSKAERIAAKQRVTIVTCIKVKRLSSDSAKMTGSVHLRNHLGTKVKVVLLMQIYGRGGGGRTTYSLNNSPTVVLGKHSKAVEAGSAIQIPSPVLKTRVETILYLHGKVIANGDHFSPKVHLHHIHP